MQTGEMLSILRWYKAAGVNLGVGAEPVDQFDVFKEKAVARSTPEGQSRADIIAVTKGTHFGATKPKANPAPQTPIEMEQGDPVQAAQKASDAKNLDDLKSALHDLQGCALRDRATQMVFGDGHSKAKIMLVGKAPSKQDDLLGQTFCGPAGAMLDNMLKAIGLERAEIYLTNIVPWRPPGNRDPAPHEIAMCLPFLKRQIELVAPNIIVTFGELATKSVLGEQASVGQLRGQWQEAQINQHSAKILTSLHPEFLLKQPAQKRFVWSDLQLIKKAI